MRALIGILATALSALSACAEAPEIPTIPDLSAAEPQVRRAITDSHERLAREPASAERWGHYASTLAVHEFLVEAVAAYDTAARLDPGNFRWHYLAAVRLEQEDPEASLENLREAIRLDDSYAPVHRRYASALERRGEFEAALLSYRRAVELDPGDAWTIAGLGGRLLDDGRLDEAQGHFERAVQIEPRCRPALAGLAACHRRRGDATEASRLEKRAASAPRFPPYDELVDAVEQLGASTSAVTARVQVLRETGRSAAAKRAVQRLLQANPDSAAGRAMLGDLLIDEGAPDMAVEQFQLAVQSEPDSVTARTGLARGLSRMGRLAEAEQQYELVLRDHPYSALTHANLATCLAQMGRLDQARAHFERALELAPQSFHARAGLGAALYAMGEYDGAVEALMRAVAEAEEPWNEATVEAAGHAGLALAALGRHQEAAAMLGRVMAADPRHRAFRHALAAVHIAAGGDREAIEVFRAGLKLHPDAGAMAITLASLLATSRHDDLRDGAEALRLADQWAAATQNRNAEVLDVRACACAELGRFEEAISTAQRAVGLARAAGDAELEASIARHLEAFQQRRPVRAP